MKAIVAAPIIFQTLLITWLRLAVGRMYYPYGGDDRQILATGGEAIYFLFVTGLNIVILFGWPRSSPFFSDSTPRHRGGR